MKTTIPGSQRRSAPWATVSSGSRQPAVRLGAAAAASGYWTYAWASENGDREAVLMVNVDPSAVSAKTRALFYKVLNEAYCSTAG